ncbi:hypothetical protein [Rhodopseudomonas palustris]|uniref:hypothetical protein n=1 Tax=Rhodopseudomonas palustris TaxID=1076 RepID=UPI0021F26020|nr:hypothetical protein [Rhodopseudomonas palustris]UYO55710.1 hypothetical protein KQX61_10035 [Rhodopseudomonas palustris]
MTLHQPMCPPPRGLRLVSETRIRHRSPVPAGSDRAAAAACMARLLRVTAVLEQRDGAAFDRVEADRALAFFAVIAEGISDAAPGEAAALDFLRDHPNFATFVLTGDVDALICAAAGARSRH